MLYVISRSASFWTLWRRHTRPDGLNIYRPIDRFDTRDEAVASLPVHLRPFAFKAPQWSDREPAGVA